MINHFVVILVPYYLNVVSRLEVDALTLSGDGHLTIQNNNKAYITTAPISYK